LLEQILASRHDWQGAILDRVIYCTAVIDAATNPSGFNDQDTYLKGHRLVVREVATSVEPGSPAPIHHPVPLVGPGF